MKESLPRLSGESEGDMKGERPPAMWAYLAANVCMIVNGRLPTKTPVAAPQCVPKRAL